jgi:hypothetical protein
MCPGCGDAESRTEVDRAARETLEVRLTAKRLTAAAVL